MPATRTNIGDYGYHICWKSSIISKLANRVRRLFVYTRQIYREFDALLGPNLVSTVVRSPYQDSGNREALFVTLKRAGTRTVSAVEETQHERLNGVVPLGETSSCRRPPVAMADLSTVFADGPDRKKCRLPLLGVEAGRFIIILRWQNSFKMRFAAQTGSSPTSSRD